MELSAAGIDLLKRSEGFRAKVYKDANGFPTIGYGHKLQKADSYPNGCTDSEADQMLACDVDDAEAAVQRLVKVSLTQGQFDALVDFTFNLGAGRLGGSSLLRFLNAGNYLEAGTQILLWDHAGSVELPALKARRKAEYELWKEE
jgi:lysozyme